MKSLALCAAAAAIASFPVSALAKCKITLDSSGVEIPYQDLSFPAFEPAVFDPNVPNGTVLYEAKGSASGGAATADCGKVAVGNRAYEGVGAYNRAYQTYPTPVAGIGYRISGGIGWGAWWPQHDNYAYASAPLTAGGDFTIQLVKTGPITAAGTLSGVVGTTTYVDHGQVARMLSLTGGLPIRPTVPTCKVQNSAIGVPLGTIATLTLDRDGASPYKTFSIDLNCSGGSAGTATKMYITLTDATDPANRSGQLSLASTGSGAAKGVAVEIRRSSDDSIVRFGPDSADAGNANQWFVGEFGNTGVSIPLKARYVKTSTALGPGAADAKATFTMSYQ